MKKSGLLSLLVTVAIGSIAQEPRVDIIDTASKYKQPTLRDQLIKQGKLSHTTAKGNIYTLPYDNMPCLVPDLQQTARMPGAAQPYSDGQMPNAFPPRQLVPKQQNKKQSPGSEK